MPAPSPPQSAAFSTGTANYQHHHHHHHNHHHHHHRKLSSSMPPPQQQQQEQQQQEQQQQPPRMASPSPSPPSPPTAPSSPLPSSPPASPTRPAARRLSAVRSPIPLPMASVAPFDLQHHASSHFARAATSHSHHNHPHMHNSLQHESPNRTQVQHHHEQPLNTSAFSFKMPVGGRRSRVKRSPHFQSGESANAQAPCSSSSPPPLEQPGMQPFKAAQLDPPFISGVAATPLNSGSRGRSLSMRVRASDDAPSQAAFAIPNGLMRKWSLKYKRPAVTSPDVFSPPSPPRDLLQCPPSPLEVFSAESASLSTRPIETVSMVPPLLRRLSSLPSMDVFSQTPLSAGFSPAVSTQGLLQENGADDGDDAASTVSRPSTPVFDVRRPQKESISSRVLGSIRRRPPGLSGDAEWSDAGQDSDCVPPSASDSLSMVVLGEDSSPLARNKRFLNVNTGPSRASLPRQRGTSENALLVTIAKQSPVAPPGLPSATGTVNGSAPSEASNYDFEPPLRLSELDSMHQDSDVPTALDLLPIKRSLGNHESSIHSAAASTPKEPALSISGAPVSKPDNPPSAALLTAGSFHSSEETRRADMSPTPSRRDEILIKPLSSRLFANDSRTPSLEARVAGRPSAVNSGDTDSLSTDHSSLDESFPEFGAESPSFANTHSLESSMLSFAPTRVSTQTPSQQPPLSDDTSSGRRPQLSRASSLQAMKSHIAATPRSASRPDITPPPPPISKHTVVSPVLTEVNRSASATSISGMSSFFSQSGINRQRDLGAHFASLPDMTTSIDGGARYKEFTHSVNGSSSVVSHHASEQIPNRWNAARAPSDVVVRGVLSMDEQRSPPKSSGGQWSRISSVFRRKESSGRLASVRGLNLPKKMSLPDFSFRSDVSVPPTAAPVENLDQSGASILSDPSEQDTARPPTWTSWLIRRKSSKQTLQGSRAPSRNASSAPSWVIEGVDEADEDDVIHNSRLSSSQPPQSGENSTRAAWKRAFQSLNSVFSFSGRIGGVSSNSPPPTPPRSLSIRSPGRSVPRELRQARSQSISDPPVGWPVARPESDGPIAMDRRAAMSVQEGNATLNREAVMSAASSYALRLQKPDVVRNVAERGGGSFVEPTRPNRMYSSSDVGLMTAASHNAVAVKRVLATASYLAALESARQSSGNSAAEDSLESSQDHPQAATRRIVVTRGLFPQVDASSQTADVVADSWLTRPLEVSNPNISRPAQSKPSALRGWACAVDGDSASLGDSGHSGSNRGSVESSQAVVGSSADPNSSKATYQSMPHWPGFAHEKISMARPVPLPRAGMANPYRKTQAFNQETPRSSPDGAVTPSLVGSTGGASVPLSSRLDSASSDSGDSMSATVGVGRIHLNLNQALPTSHWPAAVDKVMHDDEEEEIPDEEYEDGYRFGTVVRKKDVVVVVEESSVDPAE
ncbi:hypothetical protein DFJ73DRAFT_590679 [Zopfochytrium polystomum]|nr:hypothetical protein DFJ73DRAFT_590679 [Zopfochytrium polystomum]